ncbi:MAG: hypothetical protein CBE00_09615 [Planctomycetaceae bacterium TMED240]|nr:MAG: hypothetical protein CBE00_09615 [Planctomycetaceae bacterium TMED240]
MSDHPFRVQIRLVALVSTRVPAERQFAESLRFRTEAIAAGVILFLASASRVLNANRWKP